MIVLNSRVYYDGKNGSLEKVDISENLVAAAMICDKKSEDYGADDPARSCALGCGGVFLGAC